MNTKEPMWSEATSRVLAKCIVAGIALAVLFSGVWLYQSFVSVGLPTLGFVASFPLWVIGGVGALTAIFGAPKNWKRNT